MNLVADFRTFVVWKVTSKYFHALWHWCRISANRFQNGIYWIAEWLGSKDKISIKDACGILQGVSPKNKVSKRCLEALIFANNPFLRQSIVSPCVETEFQMHICAILSVLQHQAWNQILQLLVLCNKGSSFISHIANMLPSKENK